MLFKHEKKGKKGSKDESKAGVVVATVLTTIVPIRGFGGGCRCATDRQGEIERSRKVSPRRLVVLLLLSFFFLWISRTAMEESRRKSSGHRCTELVNGNVTVSTQLLELGTGLDMLLVYP